MKGLIVEGISNAGKTTIINRLKPVFAQWKNDFLFCNQALLQRMSEHLATEEKIRSSKQTISRILDYLEFFQDRYKHSKFFNRPDASHYCLAFLSETFHVNLMIEFGFTDTHWFNTINHRLRNLQISTVFLKIREEEILDRVIIKSKSYRSVNWVNYLEKFGSTETEQAAYFIERQRQLTDYFSQSGLPMITISTTHKTWEAVEQTIWSSLSGLNTRAKT